MTPAEKYAEYCRLRDEGTLLVDAAREVGVSVDHARRYERSYRQLRGIEAQRPGGHEMPRPCMRDLPY